MSCGGGNRFSCGISRFDKHKFTSDKPANQILHDENQKKLSDLLRIREEQDKGIFQAVVQENKELDKFYKPWSEVNEIKDKK